MADGNLGSLWMSLGIKESVSKELKRIAESMTGVDSTTKKTRESLLKLANTSMEGKDARWLDKMRKSLGETSVEAKELQAVLSSIKFDGKGNGWKKLTEDIDINNLNKYASLVNEIEKTLSRMESKTGLSSAGNDLMLTVHNVRFALSQLSEIKQELSQAGGLSLSAKGLENYRASLNSLFNEGASLLSSPVANFTKLDDWVNKFDKRITDIYDSVLNQSKSVSQSATAATDSLKKEEEQAKKTAEAVASIGEKRKPAVMKESQQEAAFNKDVSKIAESNTTVREGANELAGVKQEADSAKKSIEAVRYELNEMLNAFRGAASKKLGIAEAGEKGRQYVDILNQINKKVEEWKRKEGGEANAAMIDQMAKKALSYLRLLQRIDNAERSIQEKKSANPNVDASRFKEASNVIAHFKEQLKGLEDSKFLTGVDSANVLGRYAQIWTMTLGQVDEIIGKFQKRNPLSDLDSNFSKIDSKIDSFREKLAKLRDLMSEGTSKGFKTSMLTDRITGMSGIIAQMEKAMANDGKVLSNADRMKQLFSDMQVEMSKTTAAFQAYGREKGKVIAQEREHNRVINESNSIQSGDNKRIKALTEIKFLLRDIQNLEGKSSGLGVNSTTLQTIRSEVESIKGVLGGLSGRDLMGQQLKNALDKLSEIKIRAHEAMKEIGVENKSSETRKRLKDETESIVSNLSRQRRAFEENAEIRRKFSREITSLYEFTSGALNSKAFNPSDYLSQKIAEKKRELDNYINSADRVKKEIVNLGNEIKDLQNKIHGLSPTFDGKDAFGTLLSGDKLTKYNDLLDRLKSTSNSHDLLKNSLDSEKLYSANVKSFEREIDQLSKLKDRAKEFDGRNAIELKNEIIRKNKELLQSEKQYSKELSAAEKQRQSELEISRRRIQSMEKALSNLQEKRFTSKMLGLDTSEAEAKILNLKIQLSQLWELENKLFAKDMTAVGKLGNIGNGREAQAANDLARSYDRANKEAQKGIEIEQKRQAEIAKSAAKAQADLVRGFERANSHAGKLNSTVQDLKSLFLQGGLVFGAQQFAMSIITTGGEMEKQHIALQSILGDMQNANTLFGQIKELALNSPFTFSELNRDVKQLAAYGVEYDQLYDTTKRLADMSSGLGVSFDRIALAFGQVQARGWLDGKELRQIAYAGIPLLNKLSEFYSKQEGRNVSTSEIKTRISNREVSFDDVKSIFWQMTDAGGQFYNMQQTLSETLLGRYNKLKDAWEIMLSDFASGNSLVGRFFKTALDGATSLVQTLHTLAPMVTAAFSGYALTKLSRIIGGNAGSAYLSTKSKLATDATAKITEGKQLNSVERQILATKNQITGVDLRNLIANKAINKVELQRLLVAGKISAKQYQVYAALLRQQGATTSLNTKTVTYGLSWMRVGVSAKLALNGIATAASSMWAAIGGLPGLIVTGATMLIAKLWGDYTELTSAIKKTNDELVDRQKQMNEFRNSNDVKPIISGGDSKEIDNAISAYEEKLKELSPYEADLFIMSANERKSHEERLKYLDEQLKLMQEANKVVQSKLADRGNYSDLQGLFDSARRKVEQYSLAKDKLISFVPDKTESDTNNFLDKKNLERWVNNSMQQLDTASRKISEKISEMYKGIKAPKAEIESMQKQTIDSFVSGLNIPEEQMKDLRLSIYKSLGLLNGALKSELGQKLAESVSSSMPEAANAIRSGRELDEASKDKVKDIAKKCIEQMKTEYPRFANELQGLLNASNFQAVIKLIYSSDSFHKFTEAEQSLYDQYIPSPQRTGSGKKDKRFYDFLNSIGGVGKNSNEKELNDAAYQKLQKLWEVAEAAKVGKYTKAEKDKRMKAYLDQKSLTEEILGIKFTPTYNKSNKPYKPSKSKGSQEDSLLKELQERLSSLKSARQMYQKYNAILSDEEAAKKTYEQFPEVKDLDLKDYQVAVRKLLEGFNANTPERRKFKTSVYREVAEWLFSEKDKKEFDKKAADFTEFMNRLSGQWDLYKSLLEKTGDKSFAKSAFLDNFVIDNKAQELINEYNRVFKKDFRKQSLMYLSDGDAKEKLKDAGEYELWKKITELVRGNYTEALANSADLIKEALSYEEQIVATREKYNKLIENANKVGNKRAAVVARQQMEKEIGKINLDKFKNSSDYLNFYGAIVSLGQKKARSIADQIRKNINEALQSGAIDAREYAKELKQLEEQLDKLAEVQPSFLHGGLNGIVSSKKNRGNDLFTQGSSKYNEAQKMFELFQQNGDLGGMDQASQAKVAGQSMMEGGQTLMEGAGEMEGAIAVIDTIIHGINDLVQGLNDTFQDVRDTAEALGADTSSDGWTDANSFFSGFSSASASATKGWDSLKNGDIGGVISGVVGSFTGWIKAFASGHDAKLDRQIKLAERQLTELKNISSNISSVIEKTLGGIYSYQRSESTASKLSEIKKDYRTYDALAKTSFGKKFLGGKNLSHYSQDTYESALKSDSNYSAYADQLALLHAQKDELIKQRNAEEDKKKSDSDKIADYNQQITEMELSIKTFAQDFLKDIYSIDMKSWASELTDAVVGAWEKGEDAVDAYREKVKDMVKDVTKNIVTQKIMEKALEGPLDYLTGILEKKGQLDETDIDTLAGMLYDVGDKTIPQITGIFEALKKRGWDLRDNSGSASTTNSIKSITEETADLLASYLNQIRLDVSVNRENIKLIADAVTGLPELNAIARSQLTAMNQLVSLAQYRNSKLDDMYSWMRSITSGTGTKSISMK